MGSGVALLGLLGLACGPSAQRTKPTIAPRIEESPAAGLEGQPVTIDSKAPEARRCLDRVLDGQGEGEVGEAATTAPCSATTPRSCAQTCRRGDTHGCHVLGKSLAAEDADCAARLWALACDRGQLSSCTSLGELLLAQPGGDPSLGRPRLQQACEGNHAPGCTALGRHLCDAAEVGEDCSEGVVLLEKGCTLGDGVGCRLAAQHRMHGDGVATDRVRGAALARRGCELGDASACYELASALLYGRGLPQDQSQALALLEQICALDDTSTDGAACFLAAQLASPGGVQVNAHAEALFARACSKGHFDGCSVTATLHYQAGRYDEAVAIAGELIRDQPGHWPSRNARGLSLFDLGHYADAAEDLAVLAGLRPDWPYGQLWLYVARARSGQDGATELRGWLQGQDGAEWPVPVARMYLGALSPNQLLRAARHDDARKQLEQECEAYYYLSQREQIAGRSTQARRWLDKTIATGVTDFIEYGSAKAELSRWPSP